MSAGGGDECSPCRLTQRLLPAPAAAAASAAARAAAMHHRFSAAVNSQSASEHVLHARAPDPPILPWYRKLPSVP